MLNQNFVYIGILLNFIGSSGYLIGTLKGQIKPNKITFLLWSIAPLIAFAAQTFQGVGVQSIMTLSVGLFPLAILLASFVNKKAYWKTNKFDISCGLLSIVGLILWQITHIGNIAILFSIIADGFAALPTIMKAYTHPETESSWPWLASSISGILTLLTITNWQFATYGFPLYYTIIVFTIFILSQFKLNRK